jgi:hypothetical protein
VTEAFGGAVQRWRDVPAVKTVVASHCWLRTLLDRTRVMLVGNCDCGEPRTMSC